MEAARAILAEGQGAAGRITQSSLVLGTSVQIRALGACAVMSQRYKSMLGNGLSYPGLCWQRLASAFWPPRPTSSSQPALSALVLVELRQLCRVSLL